LRDRGRAGPVREIDIGGGETRRCLNNGLWLLRDEGGPYGIVLSQHDD